MSKSKKSELSQDDFEINSSNGTLSEIVPELKKKKKSKDDSCYHKINDKLTEELSDDEVSSYSSKQIAGEYRFGSTKDDSDNQAELSAKETHYSSILYNEPETEKRIISDAIKKCNSNSLEIANDTTSNGLNHKTICPNKLYMLLAGNNLSTKLSRIEARKYIIDNKDMFKEYKGDFDNLEKQCEVISYQNHHIIHDKHYFGLVNLPNKGSKKLYHSLFIDFYSRFAIVKVHFGNLKPSEFNPIIAKVIGKSERAIVEAAEFDNMRSDARIASSETLVRLKSDISSNGIKAIKIFTRSPSFFPQNIKNLCRKIDQENKYVIYNVCNNFYRIIKSSLYYSEKFINNSNYTSIEDIQKEIDNWLKKYNNAINVYGCHKDKTPIEMINDRNQHFSSFDNMQYSDIED